MLAVRTGKRRNKEATFLNTHRQQEREKILHNAGTIAESSHLS